MPRYLVERTFPGGLGLQPNEAGSKLARQIIGHNNEEHVTWIHSYVTLKKDKTYCIYDGPDPEAIRRVAERNGLPVDRISEVRVLDPYFHF